MKSTSAVNEKYKSTKAWIEQISQQMKERGIDYESSDKFHFRKATGEETENTIKEFLNQAMSEKRILEWLLDKK